MVFNWFKGLFCVFLGFGVTTLKNSRFSDIDFKLNPFISLNGTKDIGSINSPGACLVRKHS